jgi:F-type H+-transporting ATPase subunit epsilon
MNLLTLKIVSPEKLVFQENDFDSITLPTENGEITILPGHIPLVAKIIPGEIVAKRRGKEVSLVTTDGFLKLNSHGEVFILADYAIRSEDVEITKVQEAKKRAEEMMKEKGSEKDFVIAEAELRKTLLELKVVQKRKSRV